MLILLLTLIISLIAIRISWLRIQRAIYLKQFHGPAPHWLWGNMHKIAIVVNCVATIVLLLRVSVLDAYELSERGLAKLTEWQQTYGPVYAFWLSTLKPCRLFLSDPNMVASILNRPEGKEFLEVHRFLKPLLGDGLVSTSDVVKWDSHRKLLTPLFHFKALGEYDREICESVKIMLENWQYQCDQSLSVEITESVRLMTADSLHKCLYAGGDDEQMSSDRSRFTERTISALYFIGCRMYNPLLHPDFIYRLTSAGRKFYKLCDEIRKYSLDLIQTYKQNQNSMISRNNGNRSSKFVETLVNARDEDGKGLGDEDICDQVTTFVAGGYETTSSAISWALYHLAKHPDYQERCREGVNSVIGDRDTVTRTDMSQLVYLTQCINESMRVTPPVPMATRRATRDHEMEDGRTIPEGTLVMLPIYLIHHNPDVWNDPWVYDPERFTPENRAKRGIYDFMPFSVGPRNCIGKNFAMNEIKICLALAIRKFRFQLDEKVKVEMMPVVTMQTKNGIHLKLAPA